MQAAGMAANAMGFGGAWGRRDGSNEPAEEESRATAEAPAGGYSSGGRSSSHPPAGSAGYSTYSAGGQAPAVPFPGGDGSHGPATSSGHRGGGQAAGNTFATNGDASFSSSGGNAHRSGGQAPPTGSSSSKSSRDSAGKEGRREREDRPAGPAGPAPIVATAVPVPPPQHDGNAVAVGSGDPAGAPGVPLSNYAFFVRYTYSNECALLAYNFHKLVTKLGIFEHFSYRHDHRLISVTLAYIFYRYQVHHCDMALDLAVTLVYLEDVRAAPGELELQDSERSRDAFNLICYLAFLAHAFNADRTIRLADWYKEIGWRSFKNCQQLNGYVFFLFANVRKFRLRVSETRVKRYIQKLCSVPSQIHGES